MYDSNSVSLAKHRISQAKECLQSANDTLQTSLKTSVNRSYYAIFYAMRALLALERFDSKKHSGIISSFRQKFIKTGKLEPMLSDIIGAAFDVRNDSDYEDFYVVSEDEAKLQAENATKFVAAIQNYFDVILNEAKE